MDEGKNCATLIIMGDFNAKIGEGSNMEGMGKFGLGKRNSRGDRLQEFIQSNKLYIMNTFFKKSDDRKWTWESPNGITRNEIDFIISKRKNVITDVDIVDEINIGSDHRPLGGKLETVKIKNGYHNKIIKRKIRSVDLI